MWACKHKITQGQRTVYRLTLVKAWNVEELKGYAELVKLGNHQVECYCL